MDPYKVLGLSERQVKSKNIDAARHRAKRLFKRFCAEKKKFDAKKVLEAFDMIKRKLKSTPGEGEYKILGRSRKERELDKHFNHQTKEIKKNKDLKKALRSARKGEKRMLLPGEKERIPRHRRRRRRKAKPQSTSIGSLEGLQRLAAVLPQQQKFPKVIKLLHRWMKEYMNMDTREYVFEVLQGITDFEFITEDHDARQDVLAVFEYTLAYFSGWFEEVDSHRMLGRVWQTATVLPCRCFTDDPFVLSSTISQLNEILKLLENHREVLTSDAGSGEGVGLKGEAKDEVKGEVKAEVKGEVKDEVKTEDKEEQKVKAKVEAKAEEATAAKAEAKEEERTKRRRRAAPVVAVSPSLLRPPVRQRSRAPLCLPVEVESPVAKDEEVESLGSSEDVQSLGSSDDDAGDGLVDLDDSSCEDIDIKEEQDISSLSSSEEGDSSGVEIEECPIFSVPSIAASLQRLRSFFVERCLAQLFLQRNPLWARPKIDAFFQDVFYRRSIFALEQQTQVEGWQSRIKTAQRFGERVVGEANNPLEAHVPVVDSREERVAFDADSNAWAAKQTFDSRDKCGGARVIR